MTRAKRRARAKVILDRLGWRVNTAKRLDDAITDYQRICNVGTARVTRLKMTGNVNRRTLACLERSEARRKAGKPTISRSFSASTFACTCQGLYPECRRIWAPRSFVRKLERARRAGMSLEIGSACRCPRRNYAVGSRASNSRHVFGDAVDVRPTRAAGWVRSLGIFGGIGIVRATGLVLHIDGRPTRVSWYYS